MTKEILLNRMYAGNYLNDDYNIGHEVINLFKDDNGRNYIYVLYAPLSAAEFLNHPILNVVLYNNLGKNEYEKVQRVYSDWPD